MRFLSFQWCQSTAKMQSQSHTSVHRKAGRQGHAGHSELGTAIIDAVSLSKLGRGGLGKACIHTLIEEEVKNEYT
jgi:hypothetical protein